MFWFKNKHTIATRVIVTITARCDFFFVFFFYWISFHLTRKRDSLCGQNNYAALMIECNWIEDGSHKKPVDCWTFNYNTILITSPNCTCQMVFFLPFLLLIVSPLVFFFSIFHSLRIIIYFNRKIIGLFNARLHKVHCLKLNNVKGFIDIALLT